MTYTERLHAELERWVRGAEASVARLRTLGVEGEALARVVQADIDRARAVLRP